MAKVFLFIRSLRLEQWIKNVFIFAPMVFAGHLLEFDYLLHTSIAFFLFGIVCSCIYVINDCIDRNYDQYHPTKKERPIASGKLALSEALIPAVSLLSITLIAIFLYDRNFFIIALVYVSLNILYSFYLKRVVILDVLIIAFGFVLRIYIGGVVNTIDLSPWILITTFLLAIFMGLVKRRQEIARIGAQNDQINTREILKDYHLGFLDQLIAISTACAIISYILYALSPENQAKFNTDQLYLTTPFVIFAIFRYLYLTYVRGKGENPVEIIYSDFPFTINLVLWFLVFAYIILFNQV